jgi:hypothetical protein
MKDTFQRRVNPVAVEAADFEKLKPGEPCPSTLNGIAADADYFGNLKKFSDPKADSAGKPTRKK